MKVRDVMSPPVPPVGMNAVVDDVAGSMATRDLMAAPVLDDDGRLVGIITQAHLELARWEREFLSLKAFFGPIGRGRSATVGDVMTTPVASLTPGAEVDQAQQMFRDRKVPCVLVVDGFTVVGMVSPANLPRETSTV